MTSLLDLPDDVLYIITNNLDGLSIISLSKSCNRFAEFYSQGTKLRKFSISVFDINHHERDFPYDDILMLLNKSHFLTHLDFSYLLWHNSTSLLRKAIKNLRITHLNVAGSNLQNALLKNPKYLPHLTDLICSIPVNSEHTIYSPLKNLTIFCYVEFIQQFNSSDLFNSYYDRQPFFTLNEQIEKITIIGDKLGFSFFNKILREVKKFRISETEIKILQPDKENMRSFYTSSYISCDIFSLNGVHHVFETVNGIHLSRNLQEELLGFPSSSLLQKYEDIYNLCHRTIVNVHIFLSKGPENFQNIVEKTKSIIRNRSEKYINLNGILCCPVANFNAISYLSKKSNVEHLSLQACLLARKSVGDEPNNLLFKKPRLSRISSTPTEDDFLLSISKIHKDIKTLQIMNGTPHHCVMEERKLIPIVHSESILQFKNLKQLLIDHKFIVSGDFYSKIFENLNNLQILIIHSDEFTHQQNMRHLNELPKSLHLTRSLKILRLRESIHSINSFLQLFSECHSLSAIDIYYKPEIPVGMSRVSLVEMKSINHIIKKCTSVSYLHILGYKMSTTHQKKLKKLEKAIWAKHPHLTVNFTKWQYFMRNNLNFFGELIP